MTELQALGITVGSAGSVAVATGGAARAAGTGRDACAPAATHRSALLLNGGAGPVFADSAAPGARGVVLEGFLSRVGDPVSILAEDGSGHAAEDLVATAVDCLIEEAAAVGDHPAAAVLCHPAWWSAHAVEAQRAALRRSAFARAGSTELSLMPEPLAAARWLEAAHGPPTGRAIVVLDLGATGTCATVVHTGPQSATSATVRSEEPAGDEFDLLTMRYVLANALGDSDIDPFHPATERGLAILRENCRDAKEILSKNTATTVCVPLDGASDHVRLVRDELEELLRGPLITCLDLVRDAVQRAGLGLGDIDRVLLTGGGASIPLVTELVSTEFGLPVIAASEPAHTAATGAALAAADLLAQVVPDTPAAARANAAHTAAAHTTARHTTARHADTASAEAASADTASAQTETAQTENTEAETTELAQIRTAAELPHIERRRPANRRRAGVLAAAVAAIALLTTGTLAVGTGLPGEAAPATEHSDGASTGAPAAAAPPGSPTSTGLDVPAAGQPGTPAGPDSAAAQTDSPSAPGRQDTDRPATGQPATTGQTPAAQPTTGQPTEAAPAAPPPTDTPASQPGDRPASPAPAPAPAPSPGGGGYPPAPSTGGLGNTVGNTLGGVVGGVGEGVGKVGEGVGKLGEGIGEGVGGVLGGLGG